MIRYSPGAFLGWRPKGEKVMFSIGGYGKGPATLARDSSLWSLVSTTCGISSADLRFLGGLEGKDLKLSNLKPSENPCTR